MKRPGAWPFLPVLALLTACGDLVDDDFDTSVTVPAYTTEHPRVAFDEGHDNRFKCRGTYRPFVELLGNDGYEVERVRASFTSELLAPYQVLVVVGAQASEERSGGSAFEPAECDAVEAYVRGGGGLLLVTDHFPLGSAAEALGRRFGVRMSLGMSFDETEFDREFGNDSELAYSRANWLLRSHPVTDGLAGSREHGGWNGGRVERVVTFTGQSIQGPEGSTLFLRHGPTAILREAHRSSAKASMELGKKDEMAIELGPESSGVSWGQGVAFQHGAGRVVVLGEATMLTALLDPERGERGEEKVGMNRRGNDNKKLARNILRWLSE